MELPLSRGDRERGAEAGSREAAAAFMTPYVLVTPEADPVMVLHFLSGLSKVHLDQLGDAIPAG